MHQRRSPSSHADGGGISHTKREDHDPKQSREPPSMKALRDAIPPHCFKPNALISMSYIFRDIICIAALAISATYIPLLESTLLRWSLWSVYGFIQGLFFTGVWILAHECGHGALFNQSILNNAFGFTLHSFLCVPFYSWKYSHARHHRYTNHMERDTAFVPSREGQGGVQEAIEKLFDLAEDTPVLSLLMLVGHQVLGWPLYLLFEVTAGSRSSPVPKERRESSLTSSHFDPCAGIYTREQAPFILLSDLGLMATATGLYLLAQTVGSSTAALLYVLPYLWVNHWIVAITFLHHNHPDVAHYEADAWSFQKGALSTVDREFGFIGRHIFHGIIEFHVIHHLFTRIPFYHAEEATNCVRPLLGMHYKSQPTSFWTALWDTFRSCKYVVPSAGETGVLRWPQAPCK